MNRLMESAALVDIAAPKKPHVQKEKTKFIVCIGEMEMMTEGVWPIGEKV